MRLDLSWLFNKVGVLVNTCAARASLLTYSTRLNVVTWNHIVALSQSLTMAPGLPGYLTAAPLPLIAVEMLQRESLHREQLGTFNPLSPAAPRHMLLR